MREKPNWEGWKGKKGILGAAPLGRNLEVWVAL
jgi:hypothetical protein